MTGYLISNKLNTPLHLEDLNITLPRRGSSAIVPKATFDASESAKKYKHVLTVRPTNVMKPYPFHDLPNLNLIKPVKENRPSVIPEVSLEISPPQPKASSNSRSDSSIDELLKKMDEFISAANKIMNSSTPINHSVRMNVSSITSNHETEFEPHFIPSSIIPSDVNTNISVNSEESSRPDLENAMAALKKLKKK